MGRDKVSYLPLEESPLLDLASLVHDNKTLVSMTNLRSLHFTDPSQETSARLMNDI